MKLALTAGAAVWAVSIPALANGWEGLSLGVGGGYGMADSRVHDSVSAFGTTLSETSDGVPASGGFFTLSAGYDHALLGTLVVGGFVDYDFADLGSKSAYELGNQLSVGGRLGYLVAPTTLFFSTFGYAHAESADISSFGFSDLHSSTGSFDGYFVGGGVETLIGGGFSVKAEYRYTSLQSEGVTTGFDPIGSLTTTLRPQIQTARLSLNYRFGNGKHEPVDNSIPPVTSSWTAPYMGVGAGAGTADTKAGIGEELGFGHLANDGAFLTFNAGYDYQLNSRFVVGAFGDASYTNFGYDADLKISAGGLSESETVHNNFENLLMVGGRIGYLTAPDTLLFVSGGYANAGLSDTRFNLRFNDVTVDSAVVDGRRFSGGFVGGGIETRINDSLSLKAEYRYIDFGDEDLSARSTSFPGAGIEGVKFDPVLQIGMLSLNWRLGNPSAASDAPLK